MCSRASDNGHELLTEVKMEQTISRDTPLNEITFRRYEKPTMKGRDLVRKLCLSIGLLQPGDSRDVVIDVLYVLLREQREIDSETIREKVIEFRKQSNLQLLGVASSNIRRQLKRLRESQIIEKKFNNYRINEYMSLTEIMHEKLEKFLIPSVMERVKEYFKAVDEEFFAK
jgi:hypothetical protein